jgi:F0F1-type ATP synthase epsilon subunit
MSKKKMPEIVEPPAQMRVRVMSPNRQYFDGPADSITAQNDVGQFDILRDHANFFTLLSPGTITIVAGPQRFDLPIQQGLLKVAHNQVTAFVDIVSPSAKKA